ncbi:MAG: hypothetical protein Q7S45_02480 [Candidatus Curtissbacteria bacterium]|nr:hypothetical protein [Candidatus Curtissbacteria bacterium]
MPVGDEIFNGFSSLGFGLAVKAFGILFVFFYLIFSIIIFRQTQLMTRVLPATTISPFLKFIAILQIGVSLALLFSVIGVF